MTSSALSRTARPFGSRLLRVLVVATMIAVGFVVAQPAPQAEALSGSSFKAGYIIADEKFYDGNAMSEGEIQAFLDAKIGSCQNTLCLNVLRMDTPTRAWSFGTCATYQGGAAESAARIIYKVQQACNLSAKVILVTLQKEQGLVTRTSPSDGILRKAMGYGCPDTSDCDANFYGFFNQVYAAGRQLTWYNNPEGSFTTLKIGQSNPIAFNPNAACGTGSVTIKNKATAALYYYTPYQPNAAALANLDGTGDGCSAYGNRNFWVYYNSWFGSTLGDPVGALASLTPGTNTVTVSGWAADPDIPSSPIKVRVRGAGWSQLLTANGDSPESASAFNGAGTRHGFSGTVYAGIGANQKICVDAVTQSLGVDLTLGCTTVTVPSSTSSIGRIAGIDRFATSAQISAQYSPGVPVAYVASGWNFPDALSVVPAAAAQDAPLLLVSNDALPASVATELARLKPQKITIIGGPSVVSTTVSAALKKYGPVDRIAGADRWQTSLAVGEVLGAARSGKAFIVTGRDFPDALSAASAAGVQKSPVVLVDGIANNLPAGLAGSLRKWGVTSLTLVGGPAVISTALQQKLAAVPGITAVTRLSGASRFDTSLAVNNAAYPTASAGYISSAYSFADSLAGGALAGRNAAPLYLAQGSCVPTGVIAHIQKAKVSTLTLLGGTQALSGVVAALGPCG